MATKSYPIIPYELIKQAIDGDIEAVNQIREHYRPYFSKLSLRLMNDEYGNTHMVVDEVLRGRLESRLLKMILDFEVRE
ncbi:helix-turn-helix domain-containing protein [Enterococcus faecium]|uniref:helix-turn-helix domain-containing protein n=1 Tax=Enterococcus TaxID=1350 RepID=UPI000A33743B|nr:helix-turn-helix domain-containing protein [Enterococcus faecium]OTN78295.1 hypothetical protein A5826_002147 [Enterococcus faecium]